MLLAWVVVVPAFAFIPESSHVIRSWTMANGAPSDRINNLIEGSDGFLWLATYEGLVRFDGYSYKLFNHQDHEALVGGILYVLESKPGTLWMLTTSGYLVRMADGNFTAWGAAEGLPADRAYRVAATPEGNILLAGRNGFLTIDATDTIVAFPTPGLPQLNIDVFAFAEDGTIWLATHDHSLWTWSPEAATQLSPSAAGASGERVNAIYPQPDGSVWFGLQGGAGRWDPQAKKLVFFAEPELNRQDRDLRLAAPSPQPLLGGNSLDGLFLFTKDGLQPFSLGAYSDPGETVNGITALREGGYALATYSRGLMILSPAAFPFFNRQNGLANVLVNAIVQTADRAWLIAHNRGVEQFDGSTFTPLKIDGSVLQEYTVDALLDSRGRLWLATMGAGIFMLEEGRWTQIDSAGGLATETIRCFAEDSKGNIWIATRRGIYRYNDGLQQHFGPADGLRSDYVLTIHVDADDRVWFGSARGGLQRIENGQVFPAKVGGDPAEFATRTVFSMNTDHKGIIWGGMSGGIFRIDGATVDYFNLYRQMDVDGVYHVVDDHHGFLWLTSARGLQRIDYRTLTEALETGVHLDPHVRRFGTKDGMPTEAIRPISRIHRSSDNVLWVPTENGFVVIDPDNISVSTSEPQVFFDAIQADDRQLLGFGHNSRLEADLPAGLRRIQFAFAAPSFKTFEPLLYRTRMTGFDDNWQQTTNPSVQYTNLPAGDYVFEVEVANIDGVWSRNNAQFAFSIAPQLHEQPWFWPLMTLLVLGLGMALHFSRNRILHLRSAELARQVDLRTTQIREQQDQLEANNEKLLRLNEEKNAFLGIAAHDLRSPLANIESLAELMQQDLRAIGTAQLTEHNADILNSTRRMSLLLTNLLDINRIETGQTLANAKPMDLSGAVTNVCTRARRQADNKGIHISCKVAGAKALVMADPHLTEQIIENLVSNAIKFSPANSTIKMRMQATAGHWLVHVEDFGQGIPQDEQAMVFSKFSRLSPKPTAGEPTTGLGLSIAQHLAQLMHGQISFTSADGKGSTFTLQLPKAPSAS
jgi:signal transduction histidine kinase/streptogramin lyase